jgi:hypothetical protein
MGKLTWENLGLIYEGSFGIDPKEAAQILSDHIFNKNWVGDKNKFGRMWQDQDICIAFVWFLGQVEKYQKKNRLSFTKAIERMCNEDHEAFEYFRLTSKINKMSAKRFQNLVSIWMKLPFVKRKPKTYSESYLKQQKQIAANLKKSIELNKKIEILKKKKPNIYAAKRK